MKIMVSRQNEFSEAKMELLIGHCRVEVIGKERRGLYFLERAVVPWNAFACTARRADRSCRSYQFTCLNPILGPREERRVGSIGRRCRMLRESLNKKSQHRESTREKHFNELD